MPHLPTRAILPLLPLLLVACRTTATTHSEWNHESWLGTDPQSLTKSLTVHCSPESTTVRLHVASNARAGAFDLRLRDPRGIERHAQTLTSGELETTMSWPGELGTWTLQLTTSGFVGSYALELSAGEGPIVIEIGTAGDARR